MNCQTASFASMPSKPPSLRHVGQPAPAFLQRFMRTDFYQSIRSWSMVAIQLHADSSRERCKGFKSWFMLSCKLPMLFARNQPFLDNFVYKVSWISFSLFASDLRKGSRLENLYFWHRESNCKRGIWICPPYKFARMHPVPHDKNQLKNTTNIPSTLFAPWTLIS